MKIYKAILGGLLILSVVLITPARADGFKEGQWSVTMATKTSNMPPEMLAQMKKMLDQMQNLPPDQKARMEEMQKKMGVISMSMGDQGPIMTISKCVTAQDPLSYIVPPQQVQDCHQTHEMDGSTIKFKMTCNSQLAQGNYDGSMTYTGDSMEGHMQSHVVNGGKTMDASIDLTGKYLGPCSS